MSAAGLPLDNDVRRRIIESRGRNILVEAGAGTGKTRLMVDRIVSLIQTGEVTLDRLVATTFTERAAGELKTRIRSQLLAMLPGADSQACDRYRNALASVESAAISTIHAFAARLLRELPVEAGIDPNFEVMEPAHADRYIEELWNDWREKKLSVEPRRWIRLIGLLGATGDQDGIWTIARQLLANRDLLTTGYSVPDYPDHESELARLIAQAHQAQEFARKHCTDDADLLWREGYQGLEDTIEGWSELPDYLIAKRMLGLALKTARKGDQKKWSAKQSLMQARQEREEIGQTGVSFFERWSTAALQDAIGLIGEFAEHLLLEKRTQGRLDFSDLLLLARDMLAGSQPAREYFRRQFRYILVDEFQDTDPLQCEILLYLVARDSSSDPAAQMNMDPGRLFLVGDPKQSVYRFRRADIEVYERFKQGMAKDAGAQVENIQVNFRCAEPILAWVNRIFQRQMGLEPDSCIQPPYVDLISYRDETLKGPPVSMLPRPGGIDEDAKIDRVRQIESEQIAELIRKMVTEGSYEVFDSRLKQPVPVQYRHIAVLYPKRTGLAILEEALVSRGIPYISDGGKDFYQDPEVHNLIQVLKAVENPHDGIAAAAALGGPVFAFSDEDLFRLYDATGKISLSELSPEVTKKIPELAEAIDFLLDLHRERNRKPAYRTINRILLETRFLQFSLLLNRGEQVGAKLELLRDRARHLQLSADLSFGETVGLLDQERADQYDVADKSEPDVDSDRVQLMTFHKSKGLEFPVVFLSSLSAELKGGGNRKVDQVPVREKRRMEVRVKFEKDHPIQTEDYPEAHELEEAKLRAEQVRQLYVAATRARDHLIVCCLSPDYQPDNPKRYLDLLPDLGDLSGEAVRMDGVDILPVGELEDSVEQENYFFKPEEFSRMPNPTLAAELQDFSDRLDRRIAAASVSNRAASPSRFEGEVVVGGDGPDKEFSGKEIGTSFHELMEEAVRSSASLRLSILEETAERIAVRNRIPQAGSVLVKWARRVFETPIGRQIAEAAAADLYPEVPYGHVDEQGFFHEGTIDLILRQGDQWIVVDYKTNNVAESDLDRLAEKYRAQMEAYSAALMRILGRAPVEMHLIFARHGRSICL